MRTIISLALIAFTALTALTCKQMQEVQPTRIRQVRPADASGWHQPLTLQVGWFPYKEYSFEQTGKNDWRVVKDEEADKEGVIPEILVLHPGTSDSVWLSMNIDNALLGKLVKHTLMTEEPIFEPFDEYFEVAACAKCHPADVKIGWGD